MDRRTSSGADPGYETARIVFLGIATSPLLFAAVGWFFLRGSEPAGPPGFTAWIVWGAVGATGLGLWLVFRRRAVAPVTEWSRPKREAESFTPAKLQTNLAIAWAGAESVGFAGCIAYFFLDGSLMMLVSSLAATVLCAGLSMPRRDWFRTLEREAGTAGAA